jgi:hypothetical protein
MFDLDKYQTDTHTFSLVLPTGEIRDDVKITVRGDNHPIVKEVSRNLFLESQQRAAMNKKRGRKDADPATEDDLDYLEEAGLKRAVSRVESMKGVSEGGKEVGNDKELIGAVLKKYDWILTQVMEESADAVNFCK